MNFTAKVISVILMLSLVLSVSVGFVMSAFAAEAPVIEVVAVEKDDDTVTVNIDLTEGFFNCIDIAFDTEGLDCVSITQGDAVTTASALFSANPDAPVNSNVIAIADDDGVSEGNIAVVVFEITDEDFSFSIKVTNCSVLDSDQKEEFVTPTVSGNVSDESFTTAHIHSEVINTVPADCEKDGYFIRYCSDCGETFYAEVIPSLGHTRGEWVTVVAPEINKAGEESVFCSVCGALIESRDIAPVSALVRSVSVEDKSINYKNEFTLEPSIVADEGAVYIVEYISSDTDVVIVDENGVVRGVGTGSATITCNITDSLGNVVTDTCEVNVSYSWWQWIIVILLLGFIWY